MKLRGRRPVVVVAAIVAAVAVGAGGTLAVRELVSDPGDVRSSMLTAAPITVSDPIGDASLTVGDMVSSSIATNAAGGVTAEVVVNEWTAPTSDDWIFGETGARWQIDLDNDGNSDGRVQLGVENGALRGGVFGRNGRVLCLGTTTSNASSRSYSVSFTSSCVGNVAQFRFLTQFAYDDTAFDIQSTDAASGWSPLVVNPAYVPPTTVPPSTTAPSTTAPATTAPPTVTTPPASPAFASPIISLLPARLLDSRPGSATVDGQFAGAGVRPAGSVTEVLVAGRGGVPADASAVVLNVTMVLTQGPGFATVFPCGSPVPDASNLNFVAGQTVANAVVAKVGADGKVCVFTSAGSHLLVDVNGYVPAGSDVTSLLPARLLDSRPGSATVDGQFAGAGVRPAGSVTEVLVAGRGGVPASASAAVLNVTMVLTQGPGFATVFPCGSPVPDASNLNFVAGQTVANAVVAKVGADGKVCVFTSAGSHLLVDVNGYVPAGSDVTSLLPARLLDSRPGSATVDGQSAGAGVRPAGSVTEVLVAGRGGVPASASAAVLNVTMVLTQGPGFATVFPCGSAVPDASNLNYVAGQTVANAVVAKVGADGKVCVFTSAGAQLLVDVNGYIP